MTIGHASQEMQFRDVAATAAKMRPVSVPQAVLRAGEGARPLHETAMHPGVYKAAVACWVALILDFWVTFWMSAEALFMVAISTAYAVMAIGIPFVMSRVGPKRPSPKLCLSEFAHRKFDTINGPVEGFDALLQVILVPLALSIGGIAIGFAIHAARTVQ